MSNHADWGGMENRIGNLTLLWSRENEEKSNKRFDQWMVTRDESFKKRHLIPDVPSLWAFEKFDKFLSAREELIRTRLSSLLSAM
jgi:hypothetical protein